MNTLIRILTPLIVSLIPALASSQGSTDYQSFTDNTTNEKQLLDAISRKLHQDQSTLSGKNKKYIAELYQERYELIRNKFDQKEIITNQEVQQYLNRLTQEIIGHNKNIVPSDLRVQFSRSFWPNASSMGEGTIIFNIGLFHRLQNEAQVAFVLSHELAHYYLNHSNNAIQQYVETINSEQFQKQLKEIRNSSYGQNSAVEKLALKLSFGSRRHSREFEQAADSLAIEFMKPSNFDLNEALTTLALLDSVDKDKYETQLKFDEIFNFPEYPFKKKWLNSSELSFIDTKEEAAKKKSLEDSLKTHPDCQHRIKILSPRVQQYRNPNSKKFVVDEAQFNELKLKFDYEILTYLFESDEVSRCLYQSLEMIHFNNKDPYLLAMAGKCLNKIYAAQLNHELGKIVDLPNPNYDAQYNSLLRLLQNLRLTELGAITYYYLRQNEDVGKLSEEYVAALIKSKENFGKSEEKQQWIDFYKAHFKDHKYNF